MPGKVDSPGQRRKLLREVEHLAQVAIFGTLSESYRTCGHHRERNTRSHCPPGWESTRFVILVDRARRTWAHLAARLAFWFRICEPECLRVFSHKPIVQYSVKHPEAAASLDTWYRVTRRADWSGFEDVRSVFPAVDRVGGKFVFNIAHNRHRLIAEINFTYRSVFVRAILSHAEYDRGGWEE